MRVSDSLRRLPDFRRSANVLRPAAVPTLPLGARSLPFFSTFDTGVGRLAEVLLEGRRPGAAEGLFERNGVRELAVRDRIREKMFPRLLGFNGVVPALPRGTDLDPALGRTFGLLLRVSGRVESFGALGLMGRVLRMPRFEFEDGRRMPEELRGLGADGRLTRPEAPREETRLAGDFEVRAVAEGRPVKRGEVDEGLERVGAREVPLRLERLGARVAGREVLRAEEPRAEELDDEERPRTRDVALERLEGRGAREAAGALDERLGVARRLEELDGLSFASDRVVPNSRARQARYATKPTGSSGSTCGRLDVFGLKCDMIASFRY